MSIELPQSLIEQKRYWTAVNAKMSGESTDRPLIRGAIKQESLWGSRGGAAVATEAMLQIMQNELGMTVACTTLTPDNLDAISPKNFGVDLMLRPELNGKAIKNNEDLADMLLNDREYLEYVMLQMRGSDVTFANYWLAGAAAVKARELMIERGETQIPKIIFCNHSLPARVDDQLSKRAADMHGSEFRPMDQRRADYQHYVYSGADAVIVWTDYEKQALAEHYPEIPNIKAKTHKVTIPVSFDVQTAQGMRQQKRQEYFGDSITNETTVFYFQGRLVDYKHPEMLLRAFVKAHQELTSFTGSEPDIACLIAGDGPLSKMLEQEIAQLPSHIQDKIKLPGRVEQYDGHAAGNFQLFPSEKESFGLSGVEGCLLENGLLANNIGSITEANGPGGIYVTTIEQYAHAMVQMILNPEERAKRVAMLKDYVQRYNPQETAYDLKRVIDALNLETETQ